MMIYVFLLLLLSVDFYGSSAGNVERSIGDLDALWPTHQGSTQNTHCITPSLPFNYSKTAWIYEYNLTSQDLTQFGQAVGINGDVYFFLAENRGYQGEVMICLTPDGTVRWKLNAEPVPDMDPIGVSNIVVDREGVLYYTISWSGDYIFTAKVCRVEDAQTPKPTQKCIENYRLFKDIDTPLALNEKYDLLVTAVSDNDFESVPAVLNKTTLDLFWINRHVFGAGLRGNYRCDTNTGDMFWLGGNDHLLKFNYEGKKLIDRAPPKIDSSQDFVLDKRRQVIVQPWQNASVLPWKLRVSSYNVSGTDIRVRWTWNALPSIVDNDDITPPTMDDNGTVYMASMPLVFALDDTGKLIWKSELATAAEMKTYNLVADCVAMNSRRRIIYILSGSPYFQKGDRLYFITAVHMDTGKIVQRLDLKVDRTKSILLQCPMLVGDEMFYLFWTTGEYPDLAPLRVMGLPQL